jgi:serine/threonine-protein kinase
MNGGTGQTDRPDGGEPGSAGARFGHFEIASRLGTGGMGEVFRAELLEGRVRHPVALKLIRPEKATDPAFRKMFSNEARVSALLHHQNIVRLVDFGEIRGSLYLAMEYVDGVPLGRVISDQTLPAPVAVHIVERLLSALEYVHSLTTPDGRALKLVHRDVSPANLLVSVSGEVKLTDFGIARVGGLALTKTTGVKGKVAYMAPEQLAAGAAIDGRADLFGVGVILHELIYGGTPFADVNDWIRAGHPLGVDGPLASVIRRALAPDPAERFADARAMAEALLALMPAAADADDVLAERVRRMSSTRPALPELDRLILAEFAPEDPSHPVIRMLDDGVDLDARTIAQRAPALPESTRAAEGDSFPDLSSVSGPSAVGAIGHETRAALAAVRRPARAWALLLASATLIALGAVIAPHLGHRRHTPAMDRAPVSTHVVAAPVELSPPPSVELSPPPSVELPTSRRSPLPAARVSSHGAVRSGAHVAPEAPPAVGGFLTLQTTPWASAYLGSRRLGTTPFFRVLLPAGKEILTLDLEDSGQRQKLEVRIAPGAESRMNVRLR